MRFRWVYFLVDGSASVSVVVQGPRESGTLPGVCYSLSVVCGGSGLRRLGVGFGLH